MSNHSNAKPRPRMVELSHSKTKIFAESLVTVIGTQARAIVAESLGVGESAIDQIMKRKAKTRVSHMDFVLLAKKLKIDVSQWDVSPSSFGRNDVICRTEST